MFEKIDIVPKNLSYKVETDIIGSPEGYEIHQEFTDFSGQIFRQIIDLKEQQVIDALIALGWTPPKSGRRITTQIPEGYIRDYTHFPMNQVMPPDDYLIEYINEAGLPDWKCNLKYWKKESES